MDFLDFFGRAQSSAGRDRESKNKARSRGRGGSINWVRKAKADYARFFANRERETIILVSKLLSICLFKKRTFFV